MNLAFLTPKARRAGVAAARIKPPRPPPPSLFTDDNDDIYAVPLPTASIPPNVPRLPSPGRPPDIPQDGNEKDEPETERVPTSPDALPESTPSRIPRALKTIGHHLAYHVGPGIIASVAYFDPGNWTVDLQAGSTYGYSLLFVVLLSGLGAVLLQVLACRMGVVTGLDLAQQCRRLLYPRKLTRYALLYPLYLLSESAIIFTDLAELLGSAIALNLIFPTLPLYAGVLLTSLDVLVILALWPGSGGSQSRLGRAFEMAIVLLVSAVLICFIVLIIRVGPEWNGVFAGYVPNSTLLAPGALYISIGILGATVMPHALFLGSALATQTRVPPPASALSPTLSGSTPLSPASSKAPRTLRQRVVQLFISDPPAAPEGMNGEEAGEVRRNNRLSFVRAHLGHATADIVCSLVLLAFLINSAILILGATAFYYSTSPPTVSNADIFSAHALLSTTLGPPAAFLFAFALLCSGQSASVTATMAGQIVSEGFLEWRISPFTRRLFTRLLGLIPSTIVAVAAGRSGLDTLLVASQVALSICLPGVIFPLLWVTDRARHMEVRADGEGGAGEGEVVRFDNAWWASVLGWLLFGAVCLANAYVIVELGITGP